MRNLGVVVFVAILSFVSLGCEFENSAGNSANVGRVSGVPISYGNGVYYFPHTEARFSNALSSFLGTNDCNVEAMTGDGTGAYGADIGYFVVCR